VLFIARLLEVTYLIFGDFIANVLQADSWVDNLDAKLRLMATQPLMGRAREELFPSMRSHPFGRYVIFYMPLSDGVDVVRVIHSTRDLNSVF
jgi:toxin ParE1/3/4